MWVHRTCRYANEIELAATHGLLDGCWQAGADGADAVNALLLDPSADDNPRQGTSFVIIPVVLVRTAARTPPQSPSIPPKCGGMLLLARSQDTGCA